MINVSKLILLVLASILVSDLFAYEVSIPLDEFKIPAQDLVYEQRVLTPEEAWFLRNANGLDLSSRQPADS